MRYILLKNTSFTDSCMAVWRDLPTSNFSLLLTGCEHYFAWQLGIQFYPVLEIKLRFPLYLCRDPLKTTEDSNEQAILYRHIVATGKNHKTCLLTTTTILTAKISVIKIYLFQIFCL